MAHPALILARYPDIPTYVNNKIKELENSSENSTWTSFSPNGNTQNFGSQRSPHDRVGGNTYITNNQNTLLQSNRENNKETNYAMPAGIGGLITTFIAAAAYEKCRQSAQRVFENQEFRQRFASFKSEYINVGGSHREVVLLDLESFCEKDGKLEMTRRYNDLVNFALLVVGAVSCLSVTLGFVFSSPFLKYAGAGFLGAACIWGAIRAGRKCVSKERHNQEEEAKRAARSSAAEMNRILNSDWSSEASEATA